VAQLNLYVPDELAERLRKDAEAEGKSISRHVVDKYLHSEPKKKLFSPEFWAAFDELGELPEDFVAPSRTESYPEREISFDGIVD
jgi:hypothetical protein